MKKIKMMCLDIDGTLLNSKHQITPKVKEAINRVANDSDIPVILVSARMPKGIAFLQRELGIKDPMVCYSGALILDRNGQVISKESISAVDLEEIYKVVNKQTIHMSLYKDDEWFVEKMDCWAQQESEITGIIPGIVDFFDLIKLWKAEGTGPNKILCMAKPHEINSLKEEIKNNANLNSLNIYPSKTTYLEIMPTNASKTSAISYLEKKFNVEREEIIAMGDNFNDMDMIEYAGIGVAMGNAPDQVKKIADDITLTNDEDGVAHAIKKYIF
ncbi:MAG: HAD family phosphatase [Fusobacteriaceae bacterium]|nr:HAD family phosphatase [Fusobacteriaceae bacterium]